MRKIIEKSSPNPSKIHPKSSQNRQVPFQKCKMAQVGGPKWLKIDFGSQKWTQEDDFENQVVDFGGPSLSKIEAPARKNRC